MHAFKFYLSVTSRSSCHLPVRYQSWNVISRWRRMM